MSGLRTGCVSTRPIDSRPLVVTSRIVRAMGAKTTSCRRITGATRVGSPMPQEAREQHEREHARERGDRRDRQEGREQFREVGLGHDAEQERGQEDEEGGPPEDDGGGRPEHSEAAHDVADGDHRPDDREADEHARHRPSLV